MRLVNGVNIDAADLALDSILQEKKDVELELEDMSDRLVELTYLKQLESRYHTLIYLEDLVVKELRVAFDE